MRAPQAGCLTGFLSVWFAGWTVGGIAAVGALFSADSLFSLEVLFLLVWLSGWAVAECFVIAVLAFLINGKEILEVDDAELRLRVCALGREWTRRYPLAEVANLRPVASDGGPLTFLAFDARNKTVRFGTDLNEPDTLRIAQAAWERVPSLRPAADAYSAA
jgi:hypothetical protein